MSKRRAHFQIKGTDMKYLAFAALAALPALNIAKAEELKWTPECEFVKTDKRLDPIRDKVPLSFSEEPTQFMLENDAKPTITEQRALRAWAEDNESCLNAEIKQLTKQGVDLSHTSKTPHQKINADLKLFEQGKISYREYFIREDIAMKRIMDAYYRKWHKDEIQKSLAESSKAWPSDSPYWTYYTYAMQVAQDMGDGKISRDSADQLIEAKRKEVNAQVAALSAPKTAILNCAFHFDGGPDFERPFTINYTNGTVNGFKANFTETEIRWESTSKDGIAMRFVLNRTSGTMYTSDQNTFIQAHCAPAVKQF
jgi:hypothetical protein